jgi:copper chaperone CopZ
MTPRASLILIGSFTLSLLTATVGWSKPFTEVNQDVRNVEVQAKLKAKPKTVLVYAKGLCCPSCAIGIRKMVSRLAFVDTTQANDGIELDAKHQLVTIVLKEGSVPDLNALAGAIKEAGYEPVHAYALQQNKVVTSNLASPVFRVVP